MQGSEQMMWRGSTNGSLRTAEIVTCGHPDKFCDQVADAILDEALQTDPDSRVAVECLAKNHLLVVSGEVTTKASLDVCKIAGEVYEDTVGYGPADQLTVLPFLSAQSENIREMVDKTSGENGATSALGAGDQGVQVGYASAETKEGLPIEYVMARRLAVQLTELRESCRWLGADGKTQVTMQDDRVTSVVIAAQHDEAMPIDEVRAILRRKVVEPVVGDEVPRVVINGTGVFIIGGPHADAGVVGRKIVADAYGPRVPVGGGAYSGKDPSKVDRSGAYMARLIAKTVVAHRVAGARECRVDLAFAIGQEQPESVTALTDTGHDVSEWVLKVFDDLSPRAIINRLGLQRPTGWSYLQTSAYGHYGREAFPWEQVENVATGA
jgi:S-adenosylmethionine synthetase